MTRLRWDPIASADLASYVVTRGRHPLAGAVAYEGLAPFAEVNVGLGTETFLIRARNQAGRLSPSPLRLDVTPEIPPGWSQALARDEKALGWPGTKANVVANAAGDLELAAGEWAGTYLTPTIDAGDIHLHYWSLIVSPVVCDEAFSWDDAVFAWDSGEAGARLWDGKPPTSDDPPSDLDVAWDDLVDPWNQTARPWGGPVGKLPVNGRVIVKAQFSDDGSTFTTLAEFQNHQRRARYVRFQLTLQRGSTTQYQVSVEQCDAGAALVSYSTAFLELEALGVPPSTPPPNKARVYLLKDGAGKPHLRAIKEDGTDISITAI